MLGVLEGYTIIAVAVAAGWVVGRVGLLGPDAREVLARLVFFVLAPALLFTILADADPGRLFSPLLAASLGAALVVATLHVAVVRGWWRRPVGETTIGALGAGYVNANNIGLPVATYILGEPAAVAPVILAQLLLLAPAALAVLDAASSGTVSWRRVLTQPVRNPIILGSAAGLAAALTGVTAQNVLNYADRYRTGQVVARDTIALTTLGALPVMAVVALLLH